MPGTALLLRADVARQIGGLRVVVQPCPARDCPRWQVRLRLALYDDADADADAYCSRACRQRERRSRQAEAVPPVIVSGRCARCGAWFCAVKHRRQAEPDRFCSRWCHKNRDTTIAKPRTRCAAGCGRNASFAWLDMCSVCVFATLRICVGKAPLSAATAEAIAGRYPGQEPYRCPVCTRWHNGTERTSPGKRSERAAAVNAFTQRLTVTQRWVIVGRLATACGPLYAVSSGHRLIREFLQTNPLRKPAP